MFTDKTFLHIPPNRYIFHGADFLQDLDAVSEYSSASHISINDSSDEDGGNEATPSSDKTDIKVQDDVMTSGIDSTTESDDVTINAAVTMETSNSQGFEKGATSSDIDLINHTELMKRDAAEDSEVKPVDNSELLDKEALSSLMPDDKSLN